MPNVNQYQIGLGSSLTKVKSGNEENDTVFDDLESIGDLSSSLEFIELPVLSSPDGAPYKIPTKITFDDITISGYVTASNYSKLQTLHYSKAKETWIVSTADNKTKFTFEAYVAKLTHKEKTTEDVIKFEADLTISGSVTPEYNYK